MIKLQLKPTQFQKSNGYPWKACTPFVDNKRALLIHRPRNVTVYELLGKKHLAITAWCGNSFTGTDKFTFTDSPDGKKLVCARCEAAAIANGLPSADELAGKHVHQGKVVAVKTCCNHTEE